MPLSLIFAHQGLGFQTFQRLKRIEKQKEMFPLQHSPLKRFRAIEKMKYPTETVCNRSFHVLMFFDSPYACYIEHLQICSDR